MRLRKTITRTILLIGVAMAAIALAASPATAADAKGTDEEIVTNAGAVKFSHYGDRLTARDTSADGATIRAELKYKGQILTAEAVGKGNQATVPYYLEEGAPVYLRLCYVGTSGTECTDWKGAHA